METENKKFYTCKNDRTFKEVFLKEENSDLLKALLETILIQRIKNICIQEIQRIYVICIKRIPYQENIIMKRQI